VKGLVTTSAAILAGGRSTRFGGIEKGTLIIEGRSIIERQIAELSTITSNILLVGGPKAFAPSTGCVVPDRVADCGPLGGLCTALAESASDVTIVIACDMPFVSGPLLRYLVSQASGHDAVVPRTDHGYHPLCAAYTRTSVTAVERRLAERRLKLTDLLEDLRVRAVSVEELERFGDPAHLLANVNTSEDYRTLLALRRDQV
jgi:molybdenum cofactor guanylyltransferase